MKTRQHRAAIIPSILATAQENLQAVVFLRLLFHLVARQSASDGEGIISAGRAGAFVQFLVRVVGIRRRDDETDRALQRTLPPLHLP